MILFGLALAGGEARRMGGGDKPLLEIGGRPMLARVLDVLTSECRQVAISANGDPARFAAFGVPVLDDGPFIGRGPLAGVLAGLDWAARGGADAVLTIPGDMPFVRPGLAARLAPPPACAAEAGRPNPLVALWPVSLRDDLRRFLQREETRAAMAFQSRIGARVVPVPAGMLRNVNTREELAAARDETARQGESP